MDRNEELINKRYDALMFAPDPEQAKRAAKSLAELVLGDEGVELPLEKALIEVCRKMRPASDPRDQARFDAEFLELLVAPTGSGTVTAGTPNGSIQPHTRKKAA